MGKCTSRISCFQEKANPDTAWKQQNKEAKENLVYGLVNLNQGGTLVDAFKGGTDEAAVRKIIRDTFEPYLYNGGKSQIIRKVEWVKWINFRMSKALGYATVDSRPDDEILADYESNLPHRFIKFEEHSGCWDIFQRGAMGETPLHLCLLLSGDSYMHRKLALILLSEYKYQALDFYEGEEYYGESGLHLAIVNGDFDMVKILVSYGADVNQKATGNFFLPEDQKGSNRNNKQTNYIGYAYYGEYPLSFAACFGHEDIYDYLILNGANPNVQDSFGNTLLHMVVINNKLNMYSYAVRHPSKPANTYITNAEGLTPLTLSCKLGRHQIFQEIVELGSIEVWRYSNITCSMYPLTALDTIRPNGETNWQSALMIIIDGETDEHLEMLEGGVIRQLIDDKWKTFARRRFFEHLAMACIHLLCLSIAVYLRPNGSVLLGTDTHSIIRYCFEVIVMIDCFATVCLHLDELRAQGFRGYLQNLRHAPAKAVFVIACILLLLCIPFRFTQRQLVEETLIIIAVPGSWAFLLFFARGVKLTGPFVTMIYKMFVGDLLRFVIIYGIVLIGFASGFFFLFKDIANKSIKTFETMPGTMMTLFQMTLGEFKYEEFDYTHYHVLTKIVFVVFMILVPILLLNMLIAMMGNTYQNVISKSEKEWRKQWAKIVVNLERGFSKRRLMYFLYKYSIEMMKPPKDHRGDYASGEEDSKRHRALMVIKTSHKTKAKQRKDAISNWKRFFYEVKQLIKAHHSAGNTNEFRFPDWRRTVKISTPRQSFLLQPGYGIQRRDSATSRSSNKSITNALEQLAWEHDLNIPAMQRSTKRRRSTYEDNTDNNDQKITPRSLTSRYSTSYDQQENSLTSAIKQLAWEKDINLEVKTTGSPRNVVGVSNDAPKSDRSAATNEDDRIPLVKAPTRQFDKFGYINPNCSEIYPDNSADGGEVMISLPNATQQVRDSSSSAGSKKSLIERRRKRSKASLPSLRMTAPSPVKTEKIIIKRTSASTLSISSGDKNRGELTSDADESDVERDSKL